MKNKKQLINYFINFPQTAKAVNKAPRFLKKLSDVRVTEGESLKLEVVVEGIPEAEIMWTCDGMEVPDADCSFVNNIARFE